MGKLSRDDVLKLAKLARLEFSETEIESYAEELSEILQYVEILQTVDVDGLLPTNQVTGLVNVTRPDEIVDYGYHPKDLYENVPEMEADLLKAKRMIT